MSIKTTYACDRCDTVHETPKEIWEVTLAIDNLQAHHGGRSHPIRSEHWCKRCLEIYQLVPATRGSDQKHVKRNPTPSLQDIVKELIRTIVREENEKAGITHED